MTSISAINPEFVLSSVLLNSESSFLIKCKSVSLMTVFQDQDLKHMLFSA